MFLRRFANNTTTSIVVSNAEAKTSKVIEAENLQRKIQELDTKIEFYTKCFTEAQGINIRSYLNQNNGLFNRMQTQFYRKMAQNSSSWYLSELKDLLNKRSKFQKQYDILIGVYWIKLIKRLFSLLLLAISLMSLLFLVLMGIITALYLLPIIIIFSIIFFYLKKKNIF